MTNMGKYLVAISVVMMTVGCSDRSETSPLPPGSSSSPTSDRSWLIQENEVFDGGPGKDGIPSVDNPRFISTGAVDFMSDNDLILVISVQDEIKGYPHPILDWHEIVNDVVGGQEIAITYCPLTGTGSAWNRVIDGKVTTFGVSGLLYRNNIIPYDRESDSNWSQIRLKCVQGPLKSQNPETYHMVEMPWRTWLKFFPNQQVLSTETGFSRNYQRYPYGNYRTSEQLLFPVGDDDDRFPRKERVLGVIINGEAKTYPFDAFGSDVTAIRDNFDDQELIVVGSKADNFIIAFKLTPDLADMTWEAVSPQVGGVVAIDELGSSWDLFGRAISGARAGMQLEHPDQCMGYWFSFGAFYDPEIY